MNMIDAETYLIKADSVLGVVIAAQTLQTRPEQCDYFGALCRSIIGQQVSVAAARAIFDRFDTVTQLQPYVVMSLSEEQTKAVGLSKQKVKYVTDLARHFVENPAVYDHLDKQTDEQVITELTAVRGVGVWTAQMFLMFTLKRPDGFAPDDIGLQRAIEKIYNIDKGMTKKEFASFAERWRPYRTAASLHLWQSLNNMPLE